MIQAKAITHADVRGKFLYYIKLTNGKETVLVNIGENTYKKVSKLDSENENSKTLDKPNNKR